MRVFLLENVGFDFLVICLGKLEWFIDIVMKLFIDIALKLLSFFLECEEVDANALLLFTGGSGYFFVKGGKQLGKVGGVRFIICYTKNQREFLLCQFVK